MSLKKQRSSSQTKSGYRSLASPYLAKVSAAGVHHLSTHKLWHTELVTWRKVQRPDLFLHYYWLCYDLSPHIYVSKHYLSNTGQIPKLNEKGTREVRWPKGLRHTPSQRPLDFTEATESLQLVLCPVSQITVTCKLQKNLRFLLSSCIFKAGTRSITFLLISLTCWHQCERKLSHVAIHSWHLADLVQMQLRTFVVISSSLFLSSIVVRIF